MTWNYSNTSVQTVLAAGIGAGDTAIQVGDASGLPASFPYSLILDYGAATVEVVTVTTGSGVNLTVTRGQDGTSAQSHGLNAVVVHGVVARDVQEPQTHIAASSNIHGVGASSAIVGTATTQTLTNKTIDAGSNTLSNIPDGSITGLSASKLTGNYNGGGNFVSTVDATVPLTSTGTATATGNLFEAFKGAVKQFFITAAGAISAVAGITAGTTVTAGTSVSAGTSVTGATQVIGQGSGDVVPIVGDVPNANVSDLLQLKRNSIVKAKVDKDGNATTGNVTAANVSASGTLGVTGAATLSSTAAITGNTTVGGTLGVTGAATMSSTLGVTGNINASADVNVTGNVVSNGETWHAMTFNNSWSNFGSTFVNGKYKKVAAPDHSIMIVGVLAPGVVTDGTSVTTLPAGYRPAKDTIFPIAVEGGAGTSPRMVLKQNGDLTISGCNFVGITAIDFCRVIPLDA